MNRAEGNPETDRRRILVSDLLILPDGRVLEHSLTPAFARLLSGLNPDDAQIRLRQDACGPTAPPGQHPARP